MSRQSMIEAAAQLPSPTIYGIAACRVGADYHDFELSFAEIERDTAWVESVLRRAGLGEGDMALATLSNWESPWTAAVIRAVRNIGAVYATAEVYGWDARRVGMFLQRFPVKAFVGLSGETLNGLVEMDIAARLGDVPLIWARPDAVTQVRNIASQAAEFTPLGPALGLGLPGRSGVLVNAEEWDVAVEDGDLVISSITARAASWNRFPTGRRGWVGDPDGNSLIISVDVPGAAG